LHRGQGLCPSSVPVLNQDLQAIWNSNATLAKDLQAAQASTTTANQELTSKVATLDELAIWEQAAQDKLQTSMTISILATIFGFFMAISSTLLMALTPSQKALMVSMSWMLGIVFLVLQKCFT
jgi:hypothetical protein